MDESCHIFTFHIAIHKSTYYLSNINEISFHKPALFLINSRLLFSSYGITLKYLLVKSYFIKFNCQISKNANNFVR